MFRCSEETDCPRAGYPTDVPEELQQQYHPCISPEKLAFLKAYSAMNRAIRYYLMLDYPSSRNRPLIFLLDGLLKEVTDGKLDDIAFNCLTATTTREHRRKSVVNAKKFKNRPGDVVPGYLIQAPTDNYTTLWELRLGTTLVHEDLDLDLTGVAQLKFSNIRPILEALAEELRDWDDRMFVDENRLWVWQSSAGDEMRAARREEYINKVNRLLEDLEKLGAFEEKRTLKERLKNWWNAR